MLTKEMHEAMLKQYGLASGAGLEKKTADAFAADVKKSVERSQLLADAVVNALTAGRRMNQTTKELEDVPEDPAAAGAALQELAKSVGPVVEHWRPFIEQVCSVLGEKVETVLPRGMVPDPAGLEAELNVALQHVKELEFQRDGLGAERDKLKATLQQVDEKLKGAAGEAQKSLDEVQRTLDEAQKALDEANAENETLRKENDQLKEQVDGLKQTDRKKK